MNLRRFGREIGNLEITDQSKEYLVSEQTEESKVEDERLEEDVMCPLLYKIKVNRGPGGFGFSVSSTQPATVCVVFAGSPASRRGLKVGDQIVGINGMKTTESHISDIIRIILNQKRPLELLVSRPLMFTNTPRDNPILKIIEKTPKLLSKIKKLFKSFSKDKKHERVSHINPRNLIVEEWLNKRIYTSSCSVRSFKDNISFDTTTFDKELLAPRINNENQTRNQFGIDMTNMSTLEEAIEDAIEEEIIESISLTRSKSGDFRGRLLALKILDAEIHILSRLSELAQTSVADFNLEDPDLFNTIINLINEMYKLSKFRLDSLKDLLNDSKLSPAKVITIYEFQTVSIRFTYSSYHSALCSIPPSRLHSIYSVPVDVLAIIVEHFEKYRSLVGDTRGLDLVVKVFRASINLCQSVVNKD